MSSPQSLSYIDLNIEKDRHFERFMPELLARDADVVCLQEVPRDAFQDIARRLHREVRYMPMLRGEGADGRVMGLAIYFRPEMFCAYDAVYYHKEGESGLPVVSHETDFACDRLLQYVLLEKDGVRYRVGNTHFTWTPDGYPSDAQYTDMRVLLDMLAALPDVVFSGDFNAPRILKSGEPGPVWAMLAERYRDNISSTETSTLDPELHRARPLAYVVDGLFTSAAYRADNVEVISGMSDHKMIAAHIVRVS